MNSQFKCLLRLLYLQFKLLWKYQLSILWCYRYKSYYFGVKWLSALMEWRPFHEEKIWMKNGIGVFKSDMTFVYSDIWKQQCLQWTWIMIIYSLFVFFVCAWTETETQNASNMRVHVAVFGWVCPRVVSRSLFGVLYCPIHGRRVLFLRYKKDFTLSYKKRKNISQTY